jgi:hypothetical protein
MICEDDDCTCVEHQGDVSDFLERLESWVISQKTRGNLTAGEVALFEQAIDDVKVGSW